MKEKLDELLEMWKKDSEVDTLEPGKALLEIPKLHSKYVNILSNHRLLSKESEYKLTRMKRLRWEYYTGKLDDEELGKRGWTVFPYILKSEINMYLDGDEYIDSYRKRKVLHDEIVDVCNMILKELHSRTFQIKGHIDWEKFINGVN